MPEEGQWPKACSHCYPNVHWQISSGFFTILSVCYNVKWMKICMHAASFTHHHCLHSQARLPVPVTCYCRVCLSPPFTRRRFLHQTQHFCCASDFCLYVNGALAPLEPQMFKPGCTKTLNTLWGRLPSNKLWFSQGTIYKPNKFTMSKFDFAIL